MKIIVYLVFIIIPLYQLSSQPAIIQISERIGSEIDSTTRVYFGLFSKVKNYKRAYLEKQNEQLRFVIECDSAGKSSVEYLNINQQLFDDYKYWIDNFEVITQPEYADKHNYDSTFFKNCRVTGYYSNKNKKKINVTLMDSSKITGQLLYADDDFLVLYQSNENYSWKIRNEYLKCIYYRELLSVEEFDYDLIGGHHDLYLENKSDFNSYISYVGNESSLPLLAPEIKQLIISSQKESQSKKYPDQIAILKISEYYKLKVETKKANNKSSTMIFSFGSGFINLEKQITYKMTKNFRPTQKYIVKIPNVYYFYADALMNFDSTVNASFSYQNILSTNTSGPILNRFSANCFGVNIHFLDISGSLLKKEFSSLLSLIFGFEIYFMNYSVNWKEAFIKDELGDYNLSSTKNVSSLNPVVYEFLLGSKYNFKIVKGLIGSISAAASYIPNFGKMNLDLQIYGRTYKLDSDLSNFSHFGYNIKFGLGFTF